MSTNRPATGLFHLIPSNLQPVKFYIFHKNQTKTILGQVHLKGKKFKSRLCLLVYCIIAVYPLSTTSPSIINQALFVVNKRKPLRSSGEKCQRKLGCNTCGQSQICHNDWNEWGYVEWNRSSVVTLQAMYYIIHSLLYISWMVHVLRWWSFRCLRLLCNQ